MIKPLKFSFLGTINVLLLCDIQLTIFVKYSLKSIYILPLSDEITFLSFVEFNAEQKADLPKNLLLQFTVYHNMHLPDR